MPTDIIKWADDAMFKAAPIKKTDGIRVTPQVYLLSATPDPLGAMAAAFKMYKGEPTYSLQDVTDDERRWAWDESLKTHLKAPWEFIDLHFFIEGVTRAFTHQIVRQRTATYAQESLRFAVKEGLADEVPLPPSVVGNENATSFWSQCIKNIEQAYEALVNMGIPAEDARGLLPHAVPTRMHYRTNYRGLIEHAGNRLCTQAQFEWRSVFYGIITAIRDYDPWQGPVREAVGPSPFHDRISNSRWQFKILASPLAQTFTPVCYKAGRCVFMGTLDRPCSIRERVNEGRFDEIDPAEWMLNPEAARG